MFTCQFDIPLSLEAKNAPQESGERVWKTYRIDQLDFQAVQRLLSVSDRPPSFHLTLFEFPIQFIRDRHLGVFDRFPLLVFKLDLYFVIAFNIVDLESRFQ